ncbi:hypothetical protein DC522_30175 [Microvirga sp. KLBC 81]|nr:hypothetical protein DC522_30175 [Microvirga sp. KLBC 81]
MFGPLALAAAVAKAAANRDDAPGAVLDALQRSTLPMLETTVDVQIIDRFSVLGRYGEDLPRGAYR